jgi:hypothetical protein
VGFLLTRIIYNAILNAHMEKEMLDCLILGDSIAVGTHQFRPECVSYSKGGWNTKQWNKYIETENELLKLRNKVKGKRVFWILPAGNLKASNVSIQYIQTMVRHIAEQFGDTVIPITRLQPDGIHPSWAGYKDIAEKTRK